MFNLLKRIAKRYWQDAWFLLFLSSSIIASTLTGSVHESELYLTSNFSIIVVITMLLFSSCLSYLRYEKGFRIAPIISLYTISFLILIFSLTISLIFDINTFFAAYGFLFLYTINVFKNIIKSKKLKESQNSPDRKRRILSIKEKEEVLQEMDRGIKETWEKMQSSEFLRPIFGDPKEMNKFELVEHYERQIRYRKTPKELLKYKEGLNN